MVTVTSFDMVTVRAGSAFAFGVALPYHICLLDRTTLLQDRTAGKVSVMVWLYLTTIAYSTVS